MDAFLKQCIPLAVATDKLNLSFGLYEGIVVTHDRFGKIVTNLFIVSYPEFTEYKVGGTRYHGQNKHLCMIDSGTLQNFQTTIRWCEGNSIHEGKLPSLSETLLELRNFTSLCQKQ
jgi:hypothetical protein